MLYQTEAYDRLTMLILHTFFLAQKTGQHLPFTCNSSDARRVNNGKSNDFLGYPYLMPSFEENLPTQRH